AENRALDCPVNRRTWPPHPQELRFRTEAMSRSRQRTDDRTRACPAEPESGRRSTCEAIEVLRTGPRRRFWESDSGRDQVRQATAHTRGHWAFHCHLLYHMEAGMFLTVVVS